MNFRSKINESFIFIKLINKFISNLKSVLILENKSVIFIVIKYRVKIGYIN